MNQNFSPQQRQRIVEEGLPAPAQELDYRHGVTEVRLEELGATHFVGIGGSGMSAVARVLSSRGVKVSGSDAQDSASLRELESLGIAVYLGHDASHLTGVDTLVVSTAIKADNPELVAAQQLGVRILHRSMALAAAATGREILAVAGTHGKTTTTSMLTVMLHEAGDCPSFAVGGAVAGLGANAAFGQGPRFVLEADESDASYVNYRPRVAIVTNVEPDHLDFYGSPEAVTRSFDTFVTLLGPGASLVACEDDPGSSALAARHRGELTVHTYGYAESADVRILSSEPHGEGSRSIVEFTVDGLASEQEIILAVPGEHNVRNAVAALTAGLQLGLDPETCARGLAAFRGASRRFEYKGQVQGVRVFDDYAHHPTEVTAAVAGARHVAGQGRVAVVFQPHLYSRTQAFAREFAQALDGADLALVLPVYRAREAYREDVNARTITQHSSAGSQDTVIDAHLQGQFPVESFQEAIDRLRAFLKPGDLLMTIGAGDITRLGPQFLSEKRENS